MLERCKLHFDYHDEDHSLEIRAEVAVSHKTGVEMEALTGVSVAGLTLYDMMKAVDKGMAMEGIRVTHKEKL